MSRFPNNPLEAGNFGDRDDSSDVLALLDRQRRNFELMQGSIDQEDASFQDRVEVQNGTKLTIDIEPTSNEKWFLFESVSINPASPNVNFRIAADSESTDSAVLTSEIPKIVRDKIQIEIDNQSGSLETIDIDSRAREIDKFNRGSN